MISFGFCKYCRLLFQRTNCLCILMVFNGQYIAQAIGTNSLLILQYKYSVCPSPRCGRSPDPPRSCASSGRPSLLFVVLFVVLCVLVVSYHIQLYIIVVCCVMCICCYTLLFSLLCLVVAYLCVMLMVLRLFVVFLFV